MNKNDFVYTSSYCEENVWKMLEKIENPSNFYAIFISNNSRMIPVYYQIKSEDPEKKPLVWDYHVIAIHKDFDKKQSFVYDFDSTLEFPEDFNSYVKKAIRDENIFQSKFHRMFRVISADYYLNNFASDRSHMLNDENNYSSPPPNYPCIESKSSKNNIQQFISMQKHFKHGAIMNHDDFVKIFNDF